MRQIVLLPLVLSLLMGNSLAAVRAAPSGASIGNCSMFPANSIWNTRVDNLPIDVRSADYIASIGANTGLHPDFGADYNGGPFGIPYVVVPASQPSITVTIGPAGWEDQSDFGLAPVPPNAPQENGSDAHVLVVREGECKLYELYHAVKQSNTRWQADSTALFDLNSNALRPETWTSADAAGLPILPGLVRWDEVQAGEIAHAIRFTADITQRKYIWPARHFASDNTSPTRPPMGQRFRLKASKNISSFEQPIQVIFTAFKRYGIILADNGSNWYISGAPNDQWDDEMLVDAFRLLKGSDFEAVDVSSLMLNKDSAQVKSSVPFTPTHWVYAPGVTR